MPSLYKSLKKPDYRSDFNKSLKKEVYRKALHISALWIPWVIYVAETDFAAVLFTLLLCGDLIWEYANYKKYDWARQTFGRFFFKTLRSGECCGRFFKASGATYVLLAALLSSVLFSKPVAALAMTIMLISDTLAALVGKKFGREKIYKGKTLEGTVAFLSSALFATVLFNPLYPFGIASVAACLAATLVEIYEDKIGMDDNLSIPLVVGIVLTAMG